MENEKAESIVGQLLGQAATASRYGQTEELTAIAMQVRQLGEEHEALLRKMSRLNAQIGVHPMPIGTRRKLREALSE